ncbi:MAG: bifunctional phosphopantothenoylcysteine decarboxylase/phosphopantothenate--cysteine ligase CoaBC [Pseudomonadota bacterium]|nr:bifunctional phosphopantothenoylcysteine decarboxylase/phosphopantothenate--cysteine ligase CoaBC [Pseudomonadota bacterium]
MIISDPDGAGHHAGRHVLLIVGGGIAAYKALEVARRLQDHDVTVTGVMTRGAQEFITPLSLSALTARKTFTDLFSLTDEAEMGHIRLAREADLVLIAPATANLMARAATGLADDLATTILLATTAPVLMAPAMNPAMWAHAATQDNLARLRARGVDFVGPAAGDMACGEDGTGRLSAPEDIVGAALRIIGQAGGPLSGRRAIVTSGPTVEPIDAVRFIANRSSGKQGHAIAAALAMRGADVTLVSGPVGIPAPRDVELVPVETAHDMLAACEAALPADLAVCAAAVADWHVTGSVDGKMKKADGAPPPDLTLAENPDILRHLSTHVSRPRLVVGFAAEAEDLHENAMAKLARKGCDWIVANAVTTADGESVFGSDTNRATLITGNDSETWPQMSKAALADRLAERIEAQFA